MFEKQGQNAGDNSQNLQAGRDIIYQGLSYTDTKNLVKDEAQKVFKENSLVLTEEAYQLVLSRSEELLDNFLQKLETKNPDAINSMRDPGMQYSVFNAQKEYAKTGDKDLASLLEDILVERAQQPTRNLQQIVLDECIKIAPLLTTEQFDTLSLAFILKYSRRGLLKNFSELTEYFQNYLFPFSDGIINNSSRFQHLEFTGCGRVEKPSISIESTFLEMYPYLFAKGFRLDTFEQRVGIDNVLKELLIKCFHNDSLYQILPISNSALKYLLDNKKITEVEYNSILELRKSFLMTQDEVREFLYNLFPPVEEFMVRWSASPISSLKLTSVGIAIAHANILRKTGNNMDLKIWIN